MQDGGQDLRKLKMMKQRTLKKSYAFFGKGLHTGVLSRLVLNPAPEGTGIVFVRTDLGITIPALSENVAGTERCTLLAKEGASVSTVEHLMSALTGLGVDNACIEIDGGEVPILDGSALPYAEAIAKDGLAEQEAPRRHVTPREPLEVSLGSSGSRILIEPCGHFSCDLTVDFGSGVPGVQTFHWEEGGDYAGEVAPCRTFVFFHELQSLASRGLIKGGDTDNAIVVVDPSIPRDEVAALARLMGRPGLEATPEGYLSNLTLRFPNECARHKMLDLIGDFRLCGGFMRARITAFKPGHTINSAAVRAVLNSIG